MCCVYVYVISLLPQAHLDPIHKDTYGFTVAWKTFIILIFTKMFRSESMVSFASSYVTTPEPQNTNTNGNPRNVAVTLIFANLTKND